MKTTRTVLLALALSAVASYVAAAMHEIHNAQLTVRYDDAAGTFSITDAAARTAVRDGRLEGGKGAVAVAAVTSPNFGGGSRISVTQADGSTASLELYANLPFLLVCRDVHNATGKDVELVKAVPAEFTVDLGMPADKLRTLGTAGLHPVNKHPGSYLFLTVADPATRRGVVTAWLSEDRGSGVVFSHAEKHGPAKIKAQIDYGRLVIPAGAAAKLETLAIGVFDDARLGLEAYADAVKKQYRIRLREPQAVYCSWYAEKHGAAGDEKSTVELAEFAAKKLKPFGFGVVQIDDEWQDGQHYNGPRRGFDRVRPDGPYRHGIAPVAAAVEKHGLTFGLWWLPFARNFQDPEYKQRQDWFVKRADGKPYDTPWGGTCLDLTNPAVQEQLATIARLYRSWGVKYYKMDGLWTGAACEQIYVNDGYRDANFGNNRPFHDPRVSNVEAYRGGLKLLRRAAGDDVFFSGCCVSQNMREMTAIGLVDSMRVGPDASGDIRVGPLRGSRMYFLNGRVWWNDPDPAVVRAGGSGMGVSPVTLDEARLTTSWVALTGQFFLCSDWLPDLPEERIEVLRRTMAHHNAAVRPVDYFERDIPVTWLVSEGNGDCPNFRGEEAQHRTAKMGLSPSAPRYVVGLFNFERQPLKINHTAQWLGIDPAKTYHAFDFWANRPLPDVKGRLTADLPARACRAIALRAAEDHPLVVSTSRHVTQGIIDLTGETWHGGQLSGTSALIGGDTYELRIAGLGDGGDWRLARADVSPADAAAGVKISQKSRDGLLRVTLRAPATRPVQWTLSFIKAD
jgi:hypothetical protein